MSAAAAKWRTLWLLFGVAVMLFVGSILFIVSRAH
jgi:hypothetical protein